MTRPLFLSALFACLLPLAARAQDSLPRFDCPALLAATGLGEASARPRQRLSAAPLRFIWTGDGPRPDRNRPIVLVPLRSGITARLARSEPVPLDEGVMSCTLIGISFRATLDDDTPLLLEDLRGGPRPAELPLLLIGRYDDAAAADRAFSSWVTHGYPIPVAFPEPVRDATGTGVQIFGDHRSFQPMTLLDDTRWSETNVLALNPDRASPDARIFLREAGLDASGVILALCGSGDCRDFRTDPPRQQPQEAPPPADIPDPAPAESMAENTAEDTGGAEPLTEQVAEPDAPSAPAPVTTPAPQPDPPAAPTTSPRPTDRAEAPSPPASAPEPTSPTAALRLTYLGADGREEEVPEALAQRLDCVLTALGAEVFTETPDCPDRAFEALKDRRALLRRVDDGHWQIVAGAKDRPPRAVIVTLPAGQSGAACRMDLEYDGPDGSLVRLALNPVAGVSPAQFTAIPIIPLPVQNGQVRLRLAVSAPAACGGPGREIALPTEPVLSLALAVEAQVNRAALNVVAMDAGDLEVALGLDPAGRLRLGAHILGAVESAQARLAAAWGPEAWALSSVGLARLDETDGLVRLLALPSDALRGGAATRFATIPSTARAELAEMRPRVTPESLADALAPAVADAAARGITDLSLNIIAPVTPRTALALTDPCTDSRFATLARDLSLPEGPEIDVTIFPLVRLREGDTPDLTALQPLSFDPDAPSRPGGLTRCQNGATSHTTYPFFIEPWRPDSDITGRYAAALADRMALHLMTQLTEDEARP